MKKTRVALYFLLLATTSPAAFAIETHCDNEKQVIFNCKLVNSNKIASACWIEPEEPKEQYLQYRFGVPGKLELEFPKQGFVKNDQFFYERSYSNNTGYSHYALTFNIGRNRYYIYRDEFAGSDDDGNWTGNNQIAIGISITTSGGKDISLLCDKDADYNFDGVDSLYNVIRDNQK